MSPVFDNLHIISYRIQIMKFSVLFQYPLQHVSSNSLIPRLTHYSLCIIKKYGDGVSQMVVHKYRGKWEGSCLNGVHRTDDRKAGECVE